MKKYKLFGLSLLEVVIAISILFVVGTILVLVMGTGLNQLNRAKALNIATSLASQKMEEAIGTAPNKLTSLTGTFPAPNDTYQYRITYSNPSGFPEALLQALVDVTGPLGAKVAYAQLLPAGGGHLMSSSTLAGSVAQWVGHLDKSNNTLYFKYNSNKVVMQLNSSFNPGGLTLNTYYTTMGGWPAAVVSIYFLDKSLALPNVCFFSVFHRISISSGNQICPKFNCASPRIFNWGDTVDLTAWDSSVLCDSHSAFFP